MNLVGVKALLNYLKSFFKRKNPDNYIKFYTEGDDLKITFAFNNIRDFTVIADQILNNKIRLSCIDTIYSQIINNGDIDDANFFASHIETHIRPSEFL